MTSQPVDPSSSTEDSPNIASTPTTKGSPGPEESPAERRSLQVRRAPKFVPFMIVGGIVAVVVAAILAFSSPGVEKFELSSIFGFFTVLLIIPGAGLGAVVALVIDRRSIRSARTAVVESVPEDLPNVS